jgi:hypothetical protein
LGCRLTDHGDALADLALHARSRAWFLGVDVNLAGLIGAACKVSTTMV